MAGDELRGGSAAASADAADSGVAADVEDDGSVELSLLATSHPQVQRFGKVVLQHMRSTNRLLAACRPWCAAKDFPDECLESLREVQALAGTLHKEIELVDSIDFAALQPGWGDKATVRMSRKGLISFAEVLMGRLDDLQGQLQGPAGRVKARRAEREATRQADSGHEEVTDLREKYRDKFSPRPPPPPQPAAAPPQAAEPAAPAKRPRQVASAVERADVQALLRRLLAKVDKPLERQPLRDLYRQLVNLAAVTDLALHPPLCRDAVERALATAEAALDVEMTPKAMGKLHNALQRIEKLQDAAGLPAVLLDLADSVRGL